MEMEKLNKTFDNEYCVGTITFLTKYDLHVQCRLKMHSSGKQLYWWASAPPGYGISLSGSGMPYANAVQAYDNTINKGVLQVDTNNMINFDMKYPNSYYIGLGSLYIAPHINFKLVDNSNEIQWIVPIDQGIPYRMLTYPTGQWTIPRNCCMFYEGQNYKARSQEEILRASQYPASHIMDENFWGNRPPR